MKITAVRVTPIAISDPPLLNASGVHEPFALRSIIQGEADNGLVGLGETWDELLEAMALLREADIEVLTIGQYLRPSRQHLPLHKYYTPAEFVALRRQGLEMGFRHVQSGPLVRSSYHAAEQVPGVASVAV